MKRPLGRYARSARAFWRGLDFGRTTHAVHPALAPAPSGDLENWFDAHAEGPGVWKWRHYFPAYERHLGKFRGQEVHILEIGVYSGGSMQMWREYFGDKARIYGVDIEPICRQNEGGQTRIFIGDQADKNFWKGLLTEIPRIDVVVDDGGHETHQQIATLEALLPHLQPGGVYICEDTMGSGNPFHSYMEGLSRELHAHNLAVIYDPDPQVLPVPGCSVKPGGLQGLVESIHTYPYMSVIEVRANQLERLSCPSAGTEWIPRHAVFSGKRNPSAPN